MLCDGIRRGPPGSPSAIETKLGWILNGPTQCMTQADTALQVYHVGVSDDENLNDQLRHFWELETINDDIPMSEEERHCEQHFETTHTRNADGRYIVRLPFRPECSISDLGFSRYIAVRRMRSLNQRLARDADVHAQYVNFLVEYHKLHQMEEVTPQIE